MDADGFEGGVVHGAIERGSIAEALVREAKGWHYGAVAAPHPPPERLVKRPLIAVYGSSIAQEGDDAWRLAYALGRELVDAGADVMTGGYGGVMAACSKGAHEAGGRVVGVTVELFEARGPVNPWVTERVHTPDLFARLRHLVEHADGFVVAPGSVGTLTELFLTWTLVSVRSKADAPLVLLGDHWDEYLAAHRHPALVPHHLFEFVSTAATPADAARRVLSPVTVRAGLVK